MQCWNSTIASLNWNCWIHKMGSFVQFAETCTINLIDSISQQLNWLNFYSSIHINPTLHLKKTSSPLFDISTTAPTYIDQWFIWIVTLPSYQQLFSFCYVLQIFQVPDFFKRCCWIILLHSTYSLFPPSLSSLPGQILETCL